MGNDPAGYSGTPVAKKLGLVPGSSVRLVNAPGNYWDIVEVPARKFDVVGDDPEPVDWQQVFVRSIGELDDILPDCRARMHPSSVLWVSWPKGGNRQRGDITRESVRAAVLKTDLVDIKVCAFDAEWSALKFMIRKSAR